MLFFKDLIKKALTSINSLPGLDFYIRWSGQGLVMPFYHCVSDEELIHIKHLYPIISTERFNQDLSFFLRNYNPVSSDYLIENRNKSKFRCEKNFFLSFDDGLRQFHDVAAPILLKRGIPATLFINSDFIDNKEMFYRLKISVLIEKINTKKLSSSLKKEIESLFESAGMRYNESTDLLLINDKNKELVELLALLLEVDFKEYLSVHQPYLTSSQIENLVKQGFSLGAHSASHPYYPLLTENEQIEETQKSLDFIHDQFGVKKALFSFPYTDFNISKSFFEQTKDYIDISFGTANLKLDSIATNFQRIPMEVQKNNSAESILKNEYLFYILKMLINKHIIIRK